MKAPRKHQILAQVETFGSALKEIPLPEKLKAPRTLGFLAGFFSTLLIGLLALASLSTFRPRPAATPVASVTPLSDTITAAPTGSDSRADTPEPTSARLPTSTPSLEPPGPSTTPTRSASITYTVRSGDTLFDIAQAHGVTIQTLQRANELSGETILPDQVLVIPPGPLPTPTPHVEAGVIIHTVSSGETLIGIAKRYSVTVETLQTVNDLASDVIQPGWKLEIPHKD